MKKRVFIYYETSAYNIKYIKYITLLWGICTPLWGLRYFLLHGGRQIPLVAVPISDVSTPSGWR